MKIRHDFVTNSSSSSYVIAVKDVSKCDEFQALPEWVKKAVTNHLKFFTKGAEAITTKKDLEKRIKSYYGYETSKETKARHARWFEAIEKGYAVISVEVDYNDESGNELFGDLPKEDPGDGIYLLDCDN